MGVHGLQSFIESSADFLKPRFFMENKLIIDGCSLYYHIYLKSHLDQAHGGDYDGFVGLVKHFFKTLNICRIKPYVVLDGGEDPSGKKFGTLKARSQGRIKRSHALSQGRPGEVIPILVKVIFKQVLRKLKVPLVQCFGEADWEIAALANEWNCPVLSSDSDFYIFSNNGGFMPLAHFKWRKVDVLRGTNKKFIHTKWFGFQNLCEPYNIKNKSLLSLFATILGNDYNKINKANFPKWTKYSCKAGSFARTDGILVWLSAFPSLREAIDALLKPDQKTAAQRRDALYQGVSEYLLKPSSIARFLMDGEPPSRTPGFHQYLPEWSLKPFAEGKLNSSLIDVLTLQRVILNFQVEDSQRRSSSETSRVIRQVTYGALLCSRARGAAAAEERNYVEEYSREELKLSSFMVPAVPPKEIRLDSLWETPQPLRLQVLLEALCVTSDPKALLVPEHLHLPTYVTCFWIKHAQPKAEMFWALLIGLVYGELSRTQRKDKDVVQVVSELKRLKTRKSKKVALDVELAHVYAQWQSCLKDIHVLNQLLKCPVQEPELTWAYCGSLVHALAHQLMQGNDPESYLSGTSSAIGLYRELRAAVESELEESLVTRIRTRSVPSQEPVDGIRKKFQHLMKDKEEEEKEEKVEDDGPSKMESCNIRTRHKSKRRVHNKCKLKKYERISWEDGIH